MLIHAEKIFKLWNAKRVSIFGEDAQTLKAHQVMHLIDQVKQTGPLWATSSFFGE